MNELEGNINFDSDDFSYTDDLKFFRDELVSSLGVPPSYLNIETIDIVNGGSYTNICAGDKLYLQSGQFSSTIYSEHSHGSCSYAPIDFDTTLRITDEDYFMRSMFADLREIIHVDINYDKTEFKKLKIYMRKTIEDLFKSFIDKGIIEKFNIINIYSEGDYILVIFNILKNNKLHVLNHRYIFRSKNYGLK